MLPRVFLEEGDIGKTGNWQTAFGKADAVVHLASPSVLDVRTSQTQEQSLQAARMRGVQSVVNAIQQVPAPPKVLVVASSVAVYGNRNDVADERSALGSGFLADLFRAGEEACAALRGKTRVVAVRYGQILGHGSPLAASPMTTSIPQHRLAEARAWAEKAS
jgi:hypothetical protein